MRRSADVSFDGCWLLAERFCFRSSAEAELLQISETFEVTIKAHEAPAVADRQRCEIGVGAEASREIDLVHQLVKHVPTITGWGRKTHPWLLAHRLKQFRCLIR